MERKKVTYRVFTIQNASLSHDASDLKDELRTKLAQSNIEQRLIPVSEDDDSINDLLSGEKISKDEKVLAIYDEGVTAPYIYFVTKAGMGKCGKVKDVVGLSKKVGATVCGLKIAGDEIIAIKLLTDKNKIELITNKRKEVVEPGKPQGRGSSGKKIINLKKDETIVEVHSI